MLSFARLSTRFGFNTCVLPFVADSFPFGPVKTLLFQCCYIAGISFVLRKRVRLDTL